MSEYQPTSATRKLWSSHFLALDRFDVQTRPEQIFGLSIEVEQFAGKLGNYILCGRRRRVLSSAAGKALVSFLTGVCF